MMAADAIPPQALDSEAAVLGAMLIEPLAAVPVALKALTAADFYHTAHRRLYEALTAMHADAVPIDLLTVQQRLQALGLFGMVGGPAGLIALQDATPSAAPEVVRHHAAQVKDRADRRRLLEAVDLLRDRAHDTDTPLTRIVAATSVALEAVQAHLPEEQRRLPPLRCAADIETREADWVWKSYLARGAITMLEGDPGRGKGFITIDLAARLSRGDPMPDGSPGPGRRPVIFLTGEDSPEYTEAPRLRAAGADLSMVYFVPERGPGRRWDLGADVPELRAYVRQQQAALLVIDPITEFLPGVDTHRDNDVRCVLAGLRDIAMEGDCAVLAVRHLNKSSMGAPAIYRGGGSIAFTGAARFVLTVGTDPEDRTRRALANTKNNLEELAPTLLYRIKSFGGVARVAWEGTCDLTADQVLQAPRERPRDAAQDFLREQLEDGPKGQKELLRLAEAAGLTERTLDRAKRALDVESVRTGTVWEWRLPPSCSKGATFTPKGATPQSGTLGADEPFEPFGPAKGATSVSGTLGGQSGTLEADDLGDLFADE